MFSKRTVSASLCRPAIKRNGEKRGWRSPTDKFVQRQLGIGVRLSETNRIIQKVIQSFPEEKERGVEEMRVRKRKCALHFCSQKIRGGGGGGFEPSLLYVFSGYFRRYGPLRSLSWRHYMYKLLPLTKFDVGLPAVLIKFTETFKSIAVSLRSGRPSNWDQNYQHAVYDFLRSDHYRFWNAEPSLPAVFLTDSADFRGYMQQCYHGDCDNISHVIPEMMEFLGQTADRLVEVVTNMTNEKCQMKKSGKVV